MGKYDRWNSLTAKGSGKCHMCRGTGKTGFKVDPICCGCRGNGKCSTCDGTGWDGEAHCMDCSNNHKILERKRREGKLDIFWRNKLMYGDDWGKYL